LHFLKQLLTCSVSHHKIHFIHPNPIFYQINQHLWSTNTPQIRHVHMSDTCRVRHWHTYNYTELSYFLKLLTVSACKCHVLCPYPCFIDQHILTYDNNNNYHFYFLKLLMKCQCRVKCCVTNHKKHLITLTLSFTR